MSHHTYSTKQSQCSYVGKFLVQTGKEKQVSRPSPQACKAKKALKAVKEGTKSHIYKLFSNLVCSLAVRKNFQVINIYKLWGELSTQWTRPVKLRNCIPESSHCLYQYLHQLKNRITVLIGLKISRLNTVLSKLASQLRVLTSYWLYKLSTNKIRRIYWTRT